MAGLTAVLGVAATVLTVGQFAPQAAKVWKATAGVSTATWALFSATTAAWLSYAVRDWLTALLATNVVVGPLAWSILARLAAVDRSRRRAAAAALWVFPGAGVAVLAAVEVVAVVPQCAAVWRRSDISGVSAATWALTACAQGMWGGYGLLAHQAALSAGGFAGSALAAAAFAGVAVRGRRQRPAAETAA